MKEYKKQQHTIDTLFVLTLFCVFTWCAISVVLIGSRIYSASADNMNIVFYNHNAINYITQKVQQNNTPDAIELITIDDRQVLAIHQSINNEMYTNYIYHEEGQLKELFTTKEVPFNPNHGVALMKVDEVSFTIENSLLKIDLLMDQKEHTTLLFLAKGGTIDE